MAFAHISNGSNNHNRIKLTIANAYLCTCHNRNRVSHENSAAAFAMTKKYQNNT